MVLRSRTFRHCTAVCSQPAGSSVIMEKRALVTCASRMGTSKGIANKLREISPTKRLRA